MNFGNQVTVQDVKLAPLWTKDENVHLNELSLLGSESYPLGEKAG